METALRTAKEDNFVFSENDEYKKYNRRNLVKKIGMFGVFSILTSLFFVYDMRIRVITILITLTLIVLAAIENYKYRQWKKNERWEYLKDQTDRLFELGIEYERYVNDIYCFEVRLADKWYAVDSFSDYFEYHYLYGLNNRTRAYRKDGSCNENANGKAVDKSVYKLS